MNILAIDTSGPVCGVAILSDGAIRFSQTVLNRRTHSVNLMPMVDAAFSYTGLTLADMDRLACVVGPGSFTGVRLGVSTVKGLAHGAGKPCVAVNALEALAAGVGRFDGLICPLQDARAGQVYAALFRNGAQLAARTEETLDYLSLMPYYLRAPSAERNRKLMEAAAHGE